MLMISIYLLPEAAMIRSIPVISIAGISEPEQPRATTDQSSEAAMEYHRFSLLFWTTKERTPACPGLDA